MDLYLSLTKAQGLRKACSLLCNQIFATKILNFMMYVQKSSYSYNLLFLEPLKTGQPACMVRKSGSRDLCKLYHMISEPFSGGTNTFRRGKTV